MNWFMVLGGFLMLGASVEAMFDSNFKLAGISMCYSIANFLLAGTK